MKHSTPNKTDQSYGMENKRAVIARPPSPLRTDPSNDCTLGYEVICRTREFHRDINANTEKRVENTMRNGVFLTKFEVFG